MDNFTFHSPTKLRFGKGVFQDVGKEIKSAGVGRVLLLAGGGSIRANGVYAQVSASLESAGIGCAEVWGVRPNPLISKVQEAVEVCRAEQVEAVLAVGGGSVIDSAKAVAAGYYQERAWDLFTGAAADKALPIFVCLTISATGSEMNNYAVLSNEETEQKWPFGSEAVFPKVSFIDPSVQFTLPWNQTANGAIDATAHILESYFLGTTEETAIALNESLLLSVMKAADALKKDGEDYEARANLAWAATLALNGVAGAGLKGGDWATHFIEHSISALHPDVAHGAGLGVVFPAWILHNKDENPDQFRRWAKTVWGADSVEGGVEAMRAKLREWGAPVTLGELGVSEEEIPALAAKTMEMGSVGGLKKLDEEDIQGILRLAL